MDFTSFQASFYAEETIPQNTQYKMICWLLACGEAGGHYVTLINMQIGGIGGSSFIKNAHYQGNAATPAVSLVSG